MWAALLLGESSLNRHKRQRAQGSMTQQMNQGNREAVTPDNAFETDAIAGIAALCQRAAQLGLDRQRWHRSIGAV